MKSAGKNSDKASRQTNQLRAKLEGAMADTIRLRAEMAELQAENVRLKAAAEKAQMEWILARRTLVLKIESLEAELCALSEDMYAQ